MSVHDRWHTRRPRTEPDGNPASRCQQHKLYPSAEHGKGDRWQVRWRDENGRQHKRNFAKKQGSDSETSADAFDAKIKASLNDGSYVDPAAGKITLKSYGREYEAGLTSDPATRELVARRLENWVYPLIGERQMRVLARRPSIIQGWIKAMEDGLEPSTISGIFAIVSSMFIAAIDDGIVGKNPCQARSVRLPKIPPKKVTPWTLATVRAVSAKLPDRYAAMVDVGVGCGHRQGEVFGMAVEDVDFLGRQVKVLRQIREVEGKLVFSLPKGGRERTVPLPDSVSLALAAHIQEFPPVVVTLPWRVPDGELVTFTLLFVRPRGGPLVRREFNSHVWIPARTAAGVPNTRENGFHITRHTAASAWLAAGVDIRTVAAYLGHSDPAFTLRKYAHLMPDAADRARKAMDQFFTTSEPSALSVPSRGAR